ncbi:helix-turn-helix domain-containing protein [Chryseobacterium cucumeris]|uniref:LexA family transcriptional regulator n=1 Tax=Chryseobacterium cucumeris TaxID=1813611 RepID=UPI0037BF166E
MDKSLILNDIKNHLGIEKDSEFAEFLGIKRNTLSSWRTRNSIDYDLLIAKCDWINGDWLLTYRGNMIKDESNSLAVSDTKIMYNLPSVVTVDSNDNENIPFVPAKARAGYLDGYYKPEFMKTLPTYRIPGLNNGTFRMFEVKGHSMNLTLPNKSIAVGEWVENWDENIKDGRIYIIVYDDGDKIEDGILIKRCLNRIKKYNNLICKSDTLDRTDYPNISIDPSCIKEVWELKGAFKFEFPDPSNLFKRMDDLEADAEQTRLILKKLIDNQ